MLFPLKGIYLMIGLIMASSLDLGVLANPEFIMVSSLESDTPTNLELLIVSNLET